MLTHDSVMEILALVPPSIQAINLTGIFRSCSAKDVEDSLNRITPCELDRSPNLGVICFNEDCKPSLRRPGREKISKPEVFKKLCYERQTFCDVAEVWDELKVHDSSSWGEAYYRYVC